VLTVERLDTAIIVAALIAALFVAWNNGSNNAANSVGAAVGAGVISARSALVIAAIASLGGSITLGPYVTDTVMRRIVVIELIGDPMGVSAGMISALTAAGIWTMISTVLRVPMSVHVCIIGGVLGFGLSMGMSSINWGKVLQIMITWLLVPPISATLSYAVFRIFEKSFNNKRYILLVLVLAAFISAFVPTFLTLAKAFTGSEELWMPMLLSLGVGIGASTVVTALWRREVKQGGDASAEATRILLTMTAVTMSFSFGANDVANAAGPLAAVLEIQEVPNAMMLAVIISALSLSGGILLWGQEFSKQLERE